MADTRNDSPEYERARKRVEELSGFYVHLLVYLAVNLGLFLIDFIGGDGYWFYWPLIFWGIAVLIHAGAVFLSGARFVTRWEQRKIRQLMEKDRMRPGGPPRQAPPAST